MRLIDFILHIIGKRQSFKITGVASDVVTFADADPEYFPPGATVYIRNGLNEGTHTVVSCTSRTVTLSGLSDEISPTDVWIRLVK